MKTKTAIGKENEMLPTRTDWTILERKVTRAKRAQTIARVTQQFDIRFNMDGAIAVYDEPKCYTDPEMDPAELAEYAILNIWAWNNYWVTA